MVHSGQSHLQASWSGLHSQAFQDKDDAGALGYIFRLLPESKYAVISVIKDVSISENSDA